MVLALSILAKEETLLIYMIPNTHRGQSSGQ